MGWPKRLKNKFKKRESLGRGRRQEASQRSKLSHYQCGRESSSHTDKDEDLKNWQRICHGRTGRESTVFKMDSEYYKRTISKKKEYCLSKGRAVDKCLQITRR